VIVKTSNSLFTKCTSPLTCGLHMWALTAAGHPHHLKALDCSGCCLHRPKAAGRQDYSFERAVISQMTLFRHVTRNLRGTHHPSPNFPYERNSKRDVDEQPVFSASNRLQVIHSLPTSDLCENSLPLHLKMNRKQSTNGRADHFRICIAEHLLCAPVPTGDDAIQVVAHDAVF